MPGTTHRWRACRVQFALVVCDGPPADTVGGRYGLVPIMRDRLAPGCAILLDDAEREHERAIARRWQLELGATHQFVADDKPFIRLIVPKHERVQAILKTG